MLSKMPIAADHGFPTSIPLKRMTQIVSATSTVSTMMKTAAERDCALHGADRFGSADRCRFCADDRHVSFLSRLSQVLPSMSSPWNAFA